MIPRPLRPAALGVVLLAALGGCISVLPKEKPVQMYRFGVEPAAGSAPAAPASVAEARVGVVLAAVRLPAAAAGDRMLAITGDEAAYLAGARWVSPAALLLEQATADAFAARSRTVRLQGRGETAGASGSLRLEVAAFELRYPSPGAAPHAHLEIRAVLQDRLGVVRAGRTFVADAPAARNAVSAIVPAYDAAVAQALNALVDWTDASAAGLRAAPPTVEPVPGR